MIQEYSEYTRTFPLLFEILEQVRSVADVNPEQFQRKPLFSIRHFVSSSTSTSVLCIFLWLMKENETVHKTQLKAKQKHKNVYHNTKWTHFFQPPFERHFAYNLPIAPIPISPMVGCSSSGTSGETCTFVNIVGRVPWGFLVFSRSFMVVGGQGVLNGRGWLRKRRRFQMKAQGTERGNVVDKDDREHTGRLMWPRRVLHFV